MKKHIYTFVLLLFSLSFAQSDSVTITLPNTQIMVDWGYSSTIRDYLGHDHALRGTNQLRVPKGTSISFDIMTRFDKKWTKVRVNGVEQEEYIYTGNDVRPLDKVVRWDEQMFYLYLKNVQTDMNVEIDEIPFYKYAIDTVYVDSVEHLRIFSNYVNSAGMTADGSRYYVKSAPAQFRVKVDPELGYELDTLKQYWLGGWFKGDTTLVYANPYFDPGVNQIHKNQLGGLYLDFSFFAKGTNRLIPKAIKSPMQPLVFPSKNIANWIYNLSDTETSFIFFDLKGNTYTTSAPIGERLYARLKDTAINPFYLQKSQCVYSLEVNGQSVAKNHLCNSDTLDLGVVHDPVFIRGTSSRVFEPTVTEYNRSPAIHIVNRGLYNDRSLIANLQFYRNGVESGKNNLFLEQIDSLRIVDSLNYGPFEDPKFGSIYRTTNVGDVWTWKATVDTILGFPEIGQSGNFVSVIQANCFDTTTNSMEYKPQTFSASFYQQDSLKDMGNYWLYQNQYLFETGLHCDHIRMEVFPIDEIISGIALSQVQLTPITDKDKPVANLSPSFEFIKTNTGFWTHGNQTRANALWFDGKGQTLGQNHIEVGSFFVKAPSYRGPMYLIITGAQKNPQAIRWQ